MATVGVWWRYSWCLLTAFATIKHYGAAAPSDCANKFDVHDDKIIRTEDSKKLGAKFIDSTEQRDRLECLELCCRTVRCDVFVFEEKVPGTCYLFECGASDDFKCKFTSHKNYSSAVMSSRPAAELENQIKLTQNEHEHELTQLKKFTSSKSSSSTVSPIPAINKETEITVPALDKHSERTRCSRYQFECKTSGECIAIYNACDGIPQCSDGSDEALELACPTTSNKQILTKDTNYGFQGNNYNVQTYSNKPMDITGQQINQPVQQYQWKNQQQMFSTNSLNSNNAKGDITAAGGNFVPPQYGREGEGLKWTGQDATHQNYGSNRIFTHVNGGILPDYNRQQNNLLQNNIPNRGYVAETGTGIDHNYNRNMNNINHDFHHFNTGSKTIYQNQNNADYYYEDPRPKIEQSNNVMPLLGHEYQRPIQNEKSETVITEKPVIQKPYVNETTTQSTTTDSSSYRKIEQPLSADTNIHETYFESSDDGYAIMPNGALISLVLGIMATSIMIIVIGCRLKVMRNRYRKGGKQSYAHDADFLINGMYL